MVREAEANKEADNKRKEEAELVNKAESYLSSINQGLQEKGDSIDPKQKEEATKLRDEIQNALNNKDYDTLRNKINELEKAAAYMQQAAQNQQTQSGPTDANYNSSNSQSSGSSSKDDDVIDADFTDKK